jgi:CDP-diglyceride synthetase
MAMLAVVILGYTGAMSPHIVIPALWRGGRTYWFGVLLLLALYGISEWIDQMFSGQIIIGHLIMAVVGSYTLMTKARILGVVYRERQEELGWL